MGLMDTVTSKLTEVSEKIGETGSGPLSSLASDKHGYTSVEFPQDIQGPGQRHFIRFNIVTVDGATFAADEASTESPEESATGQFLGGLAGGAIDDALGGGALAAAAGGIGGQIAGNISDQLISSEAGKNAIKGVKDLAGEALGGLGGIGSDFLGSGFFKGASGGLTSLAGSFGAGIKGVVPEGVATTFGKLNLNADMIKGAVMESVPIAKDGLNFGSFLGSIGDGMPQEISSVIGGNQKSHGDIVMYMPFGVNESYQTNWAGGDMGFVGAVAKAMEVGLAQTLESVSIGDAATEAGMRLAEAGGAVIGNENLAKKVGKMKDRVVNPYYELFFESVGPRTFTFDFKMAPKNRSEAEAIQLIVQLFKLYAAPTTTPQGQESLRFWGYPAFFEIEYWNSAEVHKIKPCALTNINVNYSGDGTNHTFFDGRPMQTDLTLTFMESELMTRTEIRAGY